MVDLSTDPGFFALLTDSYARLVKAPLVPPEADARWLYSEAPFAVLAHGTDHDPEIHLRQQGRTGLLRIFLGRAPSAAVAEPTDRAERQRLLDQVARNGFLAGYRGIRVAKSGRAS